MNGRLFEGFIGLRRGSIMFLCSRGGLLSGSRTLTNLGNDHEIYKVRNTSLLV